MYTSLLGDFGNFDWRKIVGNLKFIFEMHYIYLDHYLKNDKKWY